MFKQAVLQDFISNLPQNKHMDIKNKCITKYKWIVNTFSINKGTSYLEKIFLCEISVFTDGYDLTHTHENNKYHLYNLQLLQNTSHTLSHISQRIPEWNRFYYLQRYNAEVYIYSNIKTSTQLKIVFQLKW